MIDIRIRLYMSMYNLYQLKSTRDKPSFDSKDNYDFSNIFVLIPEAAKEVREFMPPNYSSLGY